VFSHDNLRIEKDRVVYEGITAGNIVFCEGHLVRTNPFFSWLPMKPAKGEILTIAAKDIQIKDEIFNKNGFLMDTGNGQFRVGATYEWSCLDDTITESGLAELKQKLDNMISCGYTVLKQEAGVRPSSSDRRPLLGNHPVHERVHIFNGLGTKGVMLAPYLAGKFVLCFHKNTGLHPEVDIKRFYHLYDGNSKA
jgi:glycine/D-amino acid oxidase-like deaminating enzyme